MTDAEPRIIEFLMTSDATRPADLPDWPLVLLDGDAREEPSHELITTSNCPGPITGCCSASIIPTHGPCTKWRR